MTCEQRENEIIKTMNELDEAEEKVKEAVAARDRILWKLKQYRAHRRLLGEEPVSTLISQSVTH
ncbi:hypothetical protein PFISCL1PPCAC_24118, partial [Pristionchus fissidentatus]